jgi:hypothetical protein
MAPPGSRGPLAVNAVHAAARAQPQARAGATACAPACRHHCVHPCVHADQQQASSCRVPPARRIRASFSKHSFEPANLHGDALPLEQRLHQRDLVGRLLPVQLHQCRRRCLGELLRLGLRRRIRLPRLPLMGRGEGGEVPGRRVRGSWRDLDQPEVHSGDQFPRWLSPRSTPRSLQSRARMACAWVCSARPLRTPLIVRAPAAALRTPQARTARARCGPASA